MLPRDENLELELFGQKKSSGGINFKDYDNIPVQVSAEEGDVPDPIEHFGDMENFPEVLKNNLELAGYDTPTPVQKYSIPIVLKAGRDLMACAQTGSGKTAGFLFPLISMLLKDELPEPNQGGGGGGFYNRCSKHYPYALILSPTRELTTQVLVFDVWLES